MSLLTPIHFGVPRLIFDPLVAKYLAENGVSRTFLKNYWLNSFHAWHLFLWGESLDPKYCVPSLIFGPLVAKYLADNWFPELFEKTIGSIHFIPGIYPKFFSNKVFLKNSHLCSTRLQNINLSWIFLDEVGSDQSRGILSPFMSTACWFS